MNIVGKHNGRAHEVGLEDVLFFEAFGDDCYYVTMDGKYKIDMKLYEAENYNKMGFVRVNKSYVINVFKIISLTPQVNSKFKLRMKNQTVLYVNRSYLKTFKAYLKKGEYKQ